MASKQLDLSPPKIERGQAFALSTSAPVQSLVIARIRTDGGTQARAELNRDTVAEYTQAMQDGAVFPPVVVYYDGTDHWLADGFHRVAAAEQNGLEVQAEIRPGIRRDAVLHAVGANASHGLRRTRADVQRSIDTMLRDTEWRQWSNSEIARRVGCSDKTVAAARERLSSEIPMIEQRTVERNGTVYQQAIKAAREPQNPQIADFGDTPQAARAPTLAELEARAAAVGLNIWRNGRGYETANKTGAANYQHHATLEAALVYIESRGQANARETPPADQYTTPEGWRWELHGGRYRLLSDDGWATNYYFGREDAIKEAAQIGGAPKPQGVTALPVVMLPDPPKGWLWKMNGGYFFLIDRHGWSTPAYDNPQRALDAAEERITQQREADNATETSVEKLLKQASQWQPGVSEHGRLLGEAARVASGIHDRDRQLGLMARIEMERNAGPSAATHDVDQHLQMLTGELQRIRATLHGFDTETFDQASETRRFAFLQELMTIRETISQLWMSVDEG